MEKLTNNKSILDWVQNRIDLNKSILDWVQNRIDLLQPDKVVWIDGSKEQIQALKDEAVSTGEFIKLNEEKLPDCYFHRTNPNDVARVEDRTFICTPTKEEAGPLNNWMDPDECYKTLDDIIRGSYKGKTMYVIPYSMCKVGSPFAKYGLEVTDSIYVVCNMNIITRIGQRVLDAIGPDSTDWIKGTHASCNSDPEKRYICHWPQDNTIYSVNSCYGGNVLQGKKCFALRIASNLGRQEGWMAEHMLILGIEYPRPTLPCSFLRSTTSTLVTKSGVSATTSPGSARARTADSMLSTPSTVSSASLPEPTCSPTRTPSCPASPAPSSRTLPGTWMTTPSLRGEGRIPELPFHRSCQELPLPVLRVREPERCSCHGIRLRRPPRETRSAGLPGQKLAARCLHRCGHGF